MVKVTFMGTGAAFSTRRRTNVAILVEESGGSPRSRRGTQVLIECGPTVLYQLDQAGAAAGQIRYLFVSHRHGDHILGLPMFLLTHLLRGHGDSLTVLGSGEVVQTGKDLTRLVYPELDNRLDGLSWIEMPADQPASVDLEPSIKLSTLPVSHSPQVSALALRLDFRLSGRSLVYSGDITYTEELADLAAGCDLLVHEANLSEALEPDFEANSHSGHSTARQAGRVAAQANCRILALVHLSPDYAGREDVVRAEAAQEFGGQIIIPGDGAALYL